MHINPILQPRERARRKLIIKSNFKFQRGLHLLSTILLKLAVVHDVKDSVRSRRFGFACFMTASKKGKSWKIVNSKYLWYHLCLNVPSSWRSERVETYQKHCIDRFFQAKWGYFVVTITKSEENLPTYKLFGDCFLNEHRFPIHCLM